MSIVINGSGTISGLSTGGLPDGSITTADISDAAITAAKMSGGQSGSAPAYAARAWVNFNGTGTVAIRASGNVSSITDNGVGDYTVNFAMAMPDANYCPQMSVRDNGLVNLITGMSASLSLKTNTQFRFIVADRPSGNLTDSSEAGVAIFR